MHDGSFGRADPRLVTSGPRDVRQHTLTAIFDRVMGVLDLVPTRKEAEAELASWVEQRIAARQQARRTGDYRAADSIRAEMAARGVEIEDTPSGTRWKIRVG